MFWWNRNNSQKASKVHSIQSYGIIRVHFSLSEKLLYWGFGVVSSTYLLDTLQTHPCLQGWVCSVVQILAFIFWSSKLATSTGSNWIGIWTGSLNGNSTDRHSSHFSTAKEMSVKATFILM